VVLFELIPFADAPELRQHVPRVDLVGGAGHLRLLIRLDQPHLGQLRVGHEVQRHEVRPALLKRRVELLDRLLGLALEPLGLAS
jgi:hypothetical protein